MFTWQQILQNNSMGMSAFALYLAGIITDENKMQRDIADTAEATELHWGKDTIH